MGMFVVDLENQKKSLPVNYWNWRPTVELIRQMHIVDEGRIALMHQPFTGVQVAREEARAIAERMRSEVLPRIPDGGRVLLDLSVTTDPDDGTMHYGEALEENYSAQRSWLIKFTEFCERCSGFEVI